jgi:hypothetical protein
VAHSMSGDSGTPLASKLGINAKYEVALVGAPAGLHRLLEPLAEGVTFIETPRNTTNLVHLFATKRAELSEALGAYRERLSPEAVVWVSWPKKSARVATKLSDNTIREIALPLGFVDVKVCAVTEVWSGLKLVVRKSLR